MKTDKYEIDMCNGSLFPKILTFSFPLIASGILQLLFNAADVVVVGKYADDAFPTVAVVGIELELTLADNDDGVDAVALGKDGLSFLIGFVGGFAYQVDFAFLGQSREEGELVDASAGALLAGNVFFAERVEFHRLYCSRNSFIVIICGESMSSTRKSLSPVIKTSVSSNKAVARIGESF